MKSFLLFSALFLLQTISICPSEYRYSQCKTTSYKLTRKRYQNNPLHEAASDFDKLNEIPMYIQAKFNVDQQDQHGNTPLHLLVEHNPLRRCTTNSSGPHHEWMEQQNKEYFKYFKQNVEALLFAKASVIIKNNNGQTPIDIAEESALVKEFGCRDIAKLLNDFKPKR